MSRAYRISVAASGRLSEVVHLEDGVCAPLELLPVLGKERMRELLADELARRGYTRNSKNEKLMGRRLEDGVVVEVDLETAGVTVRVTAEAAIEIERAINATATRDNQDAVRQGLQERVDAEVKAQADAQKEAARRAMTSSLEKKLAGLKEELDGVVSRVTGAALKEKARQMGEIEEMSENAETGELTIKVKLG